MSSVGSFTRPNFVSVKCVVIGDPEIGKTCSLLSFVKQKTLGDYSPNAIECYTVSLTVDQLSVSLSLQDTAGSDSYDELRPHSYRECSVVVIFFSLVSISSLEHVKSKWYPEVRKYGRGCPIVLCGTFLDSRVRSNTSHVTSLKGNEIAGQIGAVKYVEICATAAMSASGLFAESVRAALKHLSKQSPVGIPLIPSPRKPLPPPPNQTNNQPMKNPVLPNPVVQAPKPPTNQKQHSPNSPSLLNLPVSSNPTTTTTSPKLNTISPHQNVEIDDIGPPSQPPPPLEETKTTKPTNSKPPPPPNQPAPTNPNPNPRQQQQQQQNENEHEMNANLPILQAKRAPPPPPSAPKPILKHPKATSSTSETLITQTACEISHKQQQAANSSAINEKLQSPNTLPNQQNNQPITSNSPSVVVVVSAELGTSIAVTTGSINNSTPSTTPTPTANELDLLLPSGLPSDLDMIVATPRLPPLPISEPEPTTNQQNQQPPVTTSPPPSNKDVPGASLKAQPSPSFVNPNNDRPMRPQSIHRDISAPMLLTSKGKQPAQTNDTSLTTTNNNTQQSQSPSAEAPAALGSPKTKQTSMTNANTTTTTTTSQTTTAPSNQTQNQQQKQHAAQRPRPPTVVYAPGEMPNLGSAAVTTQSARTQKTLFGVWIYREIPLIPLAAANWTPSTEFYFLRVKTKAGKCIVEFISESNKKIWKTEVGEGSLLAVQDSTRFFILKLDSPLGLGFYTREESGAFVIEYMKKMYEARNYKGRRKVSWWKRQQNPSNTSTNLNSSSSTNTAPAQKPFIASVPLPAPVSATHQNIRPVSGNSRNEKSLHRIGGIPSPSFSRPPEHHESASQQQKQQQQQQQQQQIRQTPPEVPKVVETPEEKKKREELQRIDKEAQINAIAKAKQKLIEQKERVKNITKLEAAKDEEFKRSAINEAKRRVIEEKKKIEMLKLHPITPIQEQTPATSSKSTAHTTTTTKTTTKQTTSRNSMTSPPLANSVEVISATEDADIDSDSDDEDDGNTTTGTSNGGINNEESKRRLSKALCVMCNNNKVDRVLVPCGHASFCSNCIIGWMDSGNHTCPLCKIKIDGVFNIINQ